MFGMIQEIVIRFIAFNVGIDKCKNIVDVARYRWRVLWRAHAISINNEDLAGHILKYNWLGANDAKDKDGIQQASFP
jgi:hypothetical protein